MKKVNISVHGVQVAAFKCNFQGFKFTAIVKKTKSGHYFVNMYRKGEKVFDRYYRESGEHLSKLLAISLDKLKAKLFDSTLKIQLKKRSKMFGLAA